MMEDTVELLTRWSSFSGAGGGNAASFTGGGRWIPDCILAAAAAVEEVEQLLFCFDKKAFINRGDSEENNWGGLKTTIILRVKSGTRHILNCT